MRRGLILFSMLLAGPAAAAGAPANVRFFGMAVDSATAVWDLEAANAYVMAISSETGFVSVISSGTGSVNQNATSYMGLEANTTYFFKVKISTHADSSYSGPVSSPTLATVPAASGFNPADVGDRSIRFQWSANGNPPGTLYEARASTSSDFTAYSASETSSGVFFTTSALAPATAYFFRVRARNHQNRPTDWSAAVDTATLGTPGFIRVWNSTVTNSSLSVAWGDYDNDGDLDQLVGNFTQGNRVYRNNGDGSFTPVWVENESDDTFSSAWGDYDNDGDLDALFGNNADPNRLYKNNGDGTFALAWSSQESDGTLAVAWGDYDNDGDLDQLAGNKGEPNRVYRNNGGGTFTLAWSSQETDTTMTAAWGDYDNDGDLDQLIGNDLNEANRVYRNNGSGAFALAWTSAELGTTRSIAWGDSDNDGDLDFVCGNFGGANRVYRNDGAGNFTPVWTSQETENTRSAVWGDFDNDGRSDVLIGNASQPNRAYRNDGNNSFTQVWASTETDQTISVAWGDYDRDGDLDQLVGNLSDLVNRIYRNNRVEKGLSANAPPLPPSGGFSSVNASTGSGLELKWSPGSDAETPEKGLCYDLKVASFPLTDSLRQYIVSPTTGAGASPFMGNYLHGFVSAGFQPGFTLNPVKGDTTYYWSVRSIDAQLRAGEWSSEQSIYIGPPTHVKYYAVGVDSVSVTWDLSGGRSYLMVISSHADYGFIYSSGVGALNDNATSYASLPPNTTFFFKVKASFHSDSFYSPEVATATLSLPPSPASQPFPVVGFSSVTVQWGSNGNPDGTGYVLEASTWGGFSGALSSHITFALSLTTAGLASETSYFFRVKSRNSWNLDSSFLDLGSTRTLSIPPVPANVRYFAVAADSAGAAWDLCPGNSYTMIFSSHADLSPVISSGTGGLNQDTTGYFPLLANAVHYFKVKISTHPDESFSPVKSTATLTRSPGISAFSVHRTSIAVSLSPNGNPEGTSIAVTTGSFAVAESSSGVQGSTHTSLALTALVPNTAYLLKARAVNFNQIPSSATVLASTVTFANPVTVAGLQVYVTSVSVVLGSNGNPPGTQIFISTGTEGNFAVARSSSGAVSGATTTLTVFGLSTNTAYGLQAGSLNVSGSTNVTLVTISTDTFPAPPIITEIQIFNSSATVEIDLNTNPPGTLVSVSTGNFEVSASSSGTSLKLTFFGLAVNAVYTIRCRAHNAGGIQSPVVFASAATYPFPPGAGTWSEVKISSVTAAWDPNGNPLEPPTSYQVRISTDMNFGVSFSSETYALSAAWDALSANTSYYFRASAYYRTGGQTGFNSEVATFTLARSPGAAGYAVYTTSISVTLAANGNPDGTRISVTTGSFNPQETSAGILTGGSATLTLNNLTPNSPYSILARAVNFNQIPTSATVILSSSTHYSPLSVAGFQVHASSAEITLNANGNPDGTRILVSTGLNGHFDVASSSIGKISGPRSTLVILGLSTNTFYSFQAGNLGPFNSTDSVSVTASTWTLSVAPAVLGFSLYPSSITAQLGLNSNPPGTRLSISSAAFESVSSSEGAVTALSLSGLGANAVYVIKARSQNNNPNPSYSASSLVTSTTTPAAVPGPGSFAEVQISSITLAWTPNGNSLTPPTSYEMQISSWNGFSGALTSSITFSLSASSAALQANTSYHFRVSAFNRSGGQTGYDSSVATYTLARSPGLAVFSVQRTSIAVSLSPNGNPEGTFIAVTTGSFAVSDSSAGTQGVAPTSLSMSAVAPNTAYSIKIRAVNFANVPSSATVLASTVTFANPVTVEALNVFVTSVSVVLGSNGNPPGTRIFISTGVDGHFGVARSSAGLVSGASTALIVSGLSTSTAYGFQAGSLNVSGSTNVTLVTLSTVTLPAPPILLGFQIFHDSATFELDANTNPPGTLLSISTGNFEAAASSSGAMALLTLSGLSVNATYTIQARAANSGGNPSPSLLVASTATYPYPPGPGSWTEVNVSSLGVTWTANGNPLQPPTSYQVLISTDINFGVRSTSDTFALSAASQTLSPNTSYYFRASAYHRTGGQTTFNAPAATFTLARSPGISAYAIYTTSISVTLAANGNPAGTRIFVTTGSFSAQESSGGIVGGGSASLTLSNLTPNTPYTVFARALNFNQIASSATLAAAAATLAAPPAILGFNVFTASASVALGSNGNPNGTPLVFSTGTNGHFGASASSAGRISGAETVLVISNLSTNTFYGFQAGSLNADGSTNALVVAASTWTLSAPPQVLGFAIYSTSVTVQLDPNANPPGTALAVSTGSFEVSASTIGAAATLSLLNLAGNVPYTITARSQNSNPNPSYSGSVVVASTATQAFMPGTLSFISVNAEDITAQWEPNGNSLTPSTSYQAQVSTDMNFGVYSRMDTFNLFAASASLRANTSYYFRVAAYHRAGGQTAFNAPASAYTLTRSPGIVNYQIYLTSISVTLAANGNPAGTSLALTTGSFSLSESTAGTQGGLDTTLVLTRLQPVTDYTVRARAVNFAGVASSASTVGFLTTHSSSVLVSGFEVFTTSVSIRLIPNGNPDGTQVAVSTGSHGHFAVTLSSIGRIADSGVSLAIFQLSTNTFYGFQAGNFNEDGSTNAVVVTASTWTLSVIPRVLGFEMFNTSAAVRLDLNTNPPGTRLTVSTGNFESSAFSSSILSTVTISGLEANSPYSFSARSQNNSPVPSFSASVLFASTATSAFPPGPAALSSVNVSSISLAWPANGNPLVPPTSYHVQISTDMNFGVRSTSDTFALSAATDALSPNTTYYLRVAAHHRGGGTSSFNDAIATATWARSPGIAAAAYSSGSISVTLAANGNPSGTTLVISTGSFKVIDSSAGIQAGGALTLELKNLSPNTTYNILARAVNFNQLPSSATALLATRTLSSPATLLGWSLFSTSASIQLGSNGNPPGTQVAVSTGSGGHYGVALTSAGRLSGATISLVIPQLSTNAIYAFQAGTLNGDGSTNSVIISLASCTLSVSPVLAGFNVYATSASVQLGLNGNPPGTQLAVSTGNFEASNSSSGRVTTLALTGLAANHAYTFKARSFNEDNHPSGVLTAASSPTFALVPGPGAFVLVSSSALTLSWSANGNSLLPPTSYHMQASTSPDFAGSVSSLETFAFQASTGSLSSNSTYYLRVSAFHRAGGQTGFNLFSVTSTLTAAPLFSPPTNISTASVTVHWDSGGNPAGTLYRLTRSSSPQFNGAQDLSVSTSGLAALAFGGLSVNSTYYFKGSALNNNGAESAFNPPVLSTSTLANPPASLTIVLVSSDSIRVSWEMNGNPGGTLYAVEDSTDLASWEKAVVAASEFTRAGLETSTTYFFRVRALNRDLMPSAYGNVESTKTHPAPLISMTTFGGSALSSAAIQWSWLDVNETETEFQLYSTTGGAVSPQFPRSLGTGTTLSFLETGLEPNQAYGRYLKVSNEMSSVATGISTSVTLAIAPSNFNYSVVTTTSLALAWGADGNPAYTHYVVRRSSDNSAFFDLGTSTSTAWLSQGLDEGATYYHKVLARNEEGVLSPSSVTLANRTLLIPPGAVTTLAVRRAGLTEGQLVLEWVSPGNNAYENEVVSGLYDIRWNSTGPIDGEAAFQAAPFSLQFSTSLSPGQSQGRLIQNLSPGVTYFFALKLRDEAPGNFSPLSNPASAWAQQDVTPPGAIATLGIKLLSASTASISWTAPGDDGHSGSASQYDIRYSTVQPMTSPAAYLAGLPVDPGLGSIPSPLAAGSAQSALLRLAADTTYYIAMRARDEHHNWSGISNSTHVSTLDTVPPGRVQNLQAVPNTFQGRWIDISWTNPADLDLDGVWVRFSTAGPLSESSTSTASGSALATLSVPAHELAHSLLDAGVTYYYTAFSFDGRGNVAQGTSAWGVAPPVAHPIPRAPANVHAALNPGSQSLAISWEPVTHNIKGELLGARLAGYVVLKSPEQDGSNATRYVLKSTGTSFEDRIDPGPILYYRVRAMDGAGQESADSDALTSTGEMIIWSDDGQAYIRLSQAFAEELQTAGLNLRISRKSENEGGRVFKSYDYHTLDKATSLKVSRQFERPAARIFMEYNVGADGKVLAGSPGMIKPSLEAPSAADAEKMLAVYWFNGKEYVKLGGKINASRKSVDLSVGNLGIYEIRTVLRASGVALTTMYPKTITPNGDGFNDDVFFIMDNMSDFGLAGAVYDVRTAKVADLRRSASLSDTLIWDGKDSSGNTVPQGIYIYKIEAGDEAFTGTVVVAK